MSSTSMDIERDASDEGNGAVELLGLLMEIERMADKAYMAIVLDEPAEAQRLTKSIAAANQRALQLLRTAMEQ